MRVAEFRLAAFIFLRSFRVFFLLTPNQLHWLFDRQVDRPLPVTATAQMSRLLRCDWPERGEQVGATEGWASCM